ncbi:MAG: RES family NAD+ phosphorylase [Candidatus Muirbacterium halophilum]|nr:RES family NAD+ phosphorylase [Candidatus Muirbacterium halophilum]MCK9477435.1 RES family NAD+ phosphorylase [Candidatus Muirbacterium halophilum]
MNFCINCFKDNEIIEIIKGLKKKGDCDFCDKKDIEICEIKDSKIISDMLGEVIDVYSHSSFLPETFPNEKKNLIKNFFYNDWNIFNLKTDAIYKILIEICKEKYEKNPELFNESVGIKEIFDDEYLNENSILKEHKWKNFSKEIKCNNRFHTNYVNKDTLKAFLFFFEQTYEKDKFFYRARISPNERGYKAKEMGAPPQNLARAGRANAEGISCLYLASDGDTAIKEVRTGLYDYVSVGKFVLLKEAKIISLVDIEKISPFIFQTIELTQYAVNIEHLKKISSEIATPLRRNDSSIDYLPIQYICDFIKSLGYNGIEYKSTMNKKGKNFVAFGESFFKCEEVATYDVQSINYDYEKIS